MDVLIDLKLIASLRDSILADYPELFDRFPITNYINLLDKTPKEASYHSISGEVSKYWQGIISHGSPVVLEHYNRATMLDLICNFEARSADKNYSRKIIGEFHENFIRILNAIKTSEIGEYIHTSDKFLKDFSICRQHVFPTKGAQIVQPFSGLQRSVLIKKGLVQFIKYSYLLIFITRGRNPFYRTHTHLSRISDFNLLGRDQCFLQIAEMLQRHPEIKGWVGGSWLYDPALGDISPRLADLCARPAANGGWVFYVGEDQDGGALSKSATRRKLFEEGKYHPRSYMVVWPRKNLIEWAEMNRTKLS